MPIELPTGHLSGLSQNWGGGPIHECLKREGKKIKLSNNKGVHFDEPSDSTSIYSRNLMGWGRGFK